MLTSYDQSSIKNGEQYRMRILNTNNDLDKCCLGQTGRKLPTVGHWHKFATRKHDLLSVISVDKNRDKQFFNPVTIHILHEANTAHWRVSESLAPVSMLS